MPDTTSKPFDTRACGPESDLEKSHRRMLLRATPTFEIIGISQRETHGISNSRSISGGYLDVVADYSMASGFPFPSPTLTGPNA